MKRLSLTGLSIMAIGLSVSTSAQAQGYKELLTQPMIKISKNILARAYITPFNLVSSAYQGQYRDHSIPGFGALVDSARTGRITAKNLVKAAIESKELLPEMIDDRDYLRRVEVQLRSIGR